MLTELWRQYRYENNIGARGELILACLPMVKALAKRFSVYSFACCDTDDFTSVGIIGLLNALEKYNPFMNTSFRTYAMHRIRGAILDEIRSLSWTPRSIHEKVRKLGRVYVRLEHSLLHPPAEEELAEALGLDLHHFREMLLQIGPAVAISLSQNQSGNEDATLNQPDIKDPDAVYPLDQLISDEMKSILAEAIESLPDRESKVISLYYYEEMNMREIGEVLSLSEARISQVHASALLRLLRALRSKVTPPGKHNELAVN